MLLMLNFGWKLTALSVFKQKISVDILVDNLYVYNQDPWFLVFTLGGSLIDRTHNFCLMKSCMGERLGEIVGMGDNKIHFEGDKHSRE